MTDTERIAALEAQMERMWETMTEHVQASELIGRTLDELVDHVQRIVDVIRMV